MFKQNVYRHNLEQASSNLFLLSSEQKAKDEVLINLQYIVIILPFIIFQYICAKIGHQTNPGAVSLTASMRKLTMSPDGDIALT